MRILKLILVFIDAMIITVVSISLAEIHYAISVVALIIAGTFNAIKFYDYQKEKKQNKKQDEKN